ncbi:recombination regulator RecX [Streptosporangium sp. NBC_01495]|uniref:recombination regulator RecX n=1 Tax=Streptosporangium sp. NBC_01495 TaxID=2903899 RepID=UPI002E3094BB|nr:recombination regulator RecX [Streptosporangium sp. NBC_01495]
MTTGPDSGPAGEAGPRDWGAWPDEPRAGSPGRRGRGRDYGPSVPEGGFREEIAEPADDAPRGRKKRASRRGGRRSGDASPGFLPDGPDGSDGSDGLGGSGGSAEGAPASRRSGADPQAVARGICLRLLTMAPRTRAQLAEALRKREVPQEAADAVLDRFSEVGLIDDEAFAAAWVSSRHAGRGLARKALASELRHRGVDEETVNEAVDQLDPEEEAETARRLVRRKLSSTRGLEPAVRTRRLAGMLARKGYGPGLAFRVIREVLEDEGAETSPFAEDPGYPLD